MKMSLDISTYIFINILWNFWANKSTTLCR